MSALDLSRQLGEVGDRLAETRERNRRNYAAWRARVDAERAAHWAAMDGKAAR